MKKFVMGFVIGLLIATAIGANASPNIRLIINGKEIQTDVPPQLINGRVMVPARFVAEPLGAKVEWDSINRNVIITKEGATITSNRINEIGESKIEWEKLIVQGKEISTFFKESDDDILLSVHFVDKLLLYYGWRIDHNGYLYNTRERDPLGEPISLPIGQVNVHKYQYPVTILLVSLKEVNKKSGLNIKYNPLSRYFDLENH